MEKNAMNIDTVWPRELLYWHRMSSTQLSRYVDTTQPGQRVVIFVWGVLESHGPHLPLASDTHLASIAADTVAERLRTEHGVQPIIFDGWKNVGSLSATRNFPGAIGFHSSVPVIRELWEQTLTRMVREGFRKFFLVNGDGGNWMNHWYGLKWDSPVINQLTSEGVKFEGTNWDQEGGEPYLHGGHHEHALTTWACRYAPEFVRFSAIRHGLVAPDEETLKNIDGANQKYLEDVPHRERDWSTYPGQDRLRSVTEFSYAKYRELLYNDDGSPRTEGGIGDDFAAKVEHLKKKALTALA